MKKTTESSEHLLREDGQEVIPTSSRRRAVLMGSRVTTIASIMSLILLSYISIILTIDLGKKLVDRDNDLPYSPANTIIKYERRKLWGGHTKYSGPPTLEVDEAWETLLKGLNVRGTKEEITLADANQTNIVQLADKTGYPIVPLVYHHIHCLDSIRKLHYIDYYRALGYDTTFSEEHFEHCLETLRKQVMCHADLALLSATWTKSSDEETHIELRTNTESKCVNWDAIQEWAMGRYLVQGGYNVLAGPFERKKVGGHDG